ncbi:enoyl-CoA hydratase [Micromonospora craniellae]|uniref:Probable enoyl-CoA hydratase echA8 n=1 Tax=Micromonospora craniellae TaxID=2294034 RepID=A0A372FTR3_9ACTN|nr:enoyl-CoA hydratase [Micromonospora craniellae]QOC92337.1 enoyl-CoA hydratase [Micromonospora craniellae]RFS44113.1 enoyl-CoA hydratase [Micromonospora craniellae]
MSDETILIDVAHDGIAIVTLNRPHALNALSLQVMRDLTAAAATLDAEPAVKAIIITGSATAFAAGADIKEMADRTYSEMDAADWFGGWSAMSAVRTPLIAAVAGYALGGGCELAMMCDIVIAADTARFGQPEITLGVIPGMGGSQRLTRAIGKAKAMDLCLTGRTMTADEAERAGMVSRVVSADQLLDQAIQLATRIAGMSAPAARMVKEAINRSFEVSLAEGLLHERRLFHATFATADQTEGMAAFIAKRPPQFIDR